MSALITINHAISLTKARMAEVPEFPLYASIVKQLEYVASILRDEEIDRSNLKNIVVGHYGAREFEETDPELALALKDAQLIASKMAKGLKV